MTPEAAAEEPETRSAGSAGEERDVCWRPEWNNNAPKIIIALAADSSLSLEHFSTEIYVKILLYQNGAHFFVLLYAH